MQRLDLEDAERIGGGIAYLDWRGRASLADWVWGIANEMRNEGSEAASMLPLF